MADHAAATLLSRVGKTIAVIGLLSLAVLALLSGSDRQSREYPNSPGYVGWPYDTGAARAKAILAFVQTGPSSAIAHARRAIVSDPLSVQAVSILGRAQYYSGQLGPARKTFEVAGQLGWRDGMTQIYWLDQAMAAGNLRVAAERLDALLRQSPNDENRDKFLAILSASPEGRAAVAERLKLVPDWTETYANGLTDLPREQLLQRVDVMQRAGKGVWDCPGTAAITQALISAKMLDEAQSIWRSQCAVSNSLVYDGTFEQLDTTKSTAGFEWRLSGRGDVEVRPEEDHAGNRRLEFEVSAARTLPVLSQWVVLKPGRYRLTWRTPDTAPNAARALSVTLGCKTNLADAVPGNPGSGSSQRYVQDFEIDAECPAQQLVFWLAPTAQVRLDDVVLQRI